MAALAKEQFVSAFIGLFGAALGGGLSLWGTHMTLAENREIKVEANRQQSYSHLAGEKAELIMLLQLLADAHDKSTIYQSRAALLTEANQQAKRNSQRGPTPQLKAINDPEKYLADALQEERNADHYNDEVVNCMHKMFESIGLVQLSYPANQDLNSLVYVAEEMLTRTDEILPKESLEERKAWAKRTVDAEQQLSERQQQRMVYIQKAVQPITDLLVYLRGQLTR